VQELSTCELNVLTSISAFSVALTSLSKGNDTVCSHSDSMQLLFSGNGTEVDSEIQHRNMRVRYIMSTDTGV
jgi:hypothetical protein